MTLHLTSFVLSLTFKVLCWHLIQLRHNNHITAPSLHLSICQSHALCKNSPKYNNIHTSICNSHILYNKVIRTITLLSLINSIRSLFDHCEFCACERCGELRKETSLNKFLKERDSERDLFFSWSSDLEVLLFIPVTSHQAVNQQDDIFCKQQRWSCDP